MSFVLLARLNLAPIFGKEQASLNTITYLELTYGTSIMFLSIFGLSVCPGKKQASAN